MFYNNKRFSNNFFTKLYGNTSKINGITIEQNVAFSLSILWIYNQSIDLEKMSVKGGNENNHIILNYRFDIWKYSGLCT